MKVKPVLIANMNGTLVLRDNILHTVSHLNSINEHKRLPGDIVCDIYLVDKKSSINVNDICLCYNSVGPEKCTSIDIFYNIPDMAIGECTAIKNGCVFINDTDIFYRKINKIVSSTNYESFGLPKTSGILTYLITFFNEHNKLPKFLEIKKDKYANGNDYFIVENIIEHNVQPKKRSRLYTKKQVEQHLIYCVSELADKFGLTSTSILMKAWNDVTMKWIKANL